jgi:acetyl-CoA C-acetyltransferase
MDWREKRRKEMNRRDVVVVSAVRTPFGRFGGVLRDVPSIILGAMALREVVARAGLRNDEIDEVYYGSCQPAEFCLENDVPDRQAVLEAGFPPKTLSFMIDRACCASLTAVRLASQSIRFSEREVCLAAGAENMSRLPFLLPGIRWSGNRLGNMEIYDNLFALGYKGWNAISRKAAEIKLDFDGWNPVALDAGEVALEYGVSREEQDEWAVRSQQYYARALADGKFKVGEELMSVAITPKRGDPILFEKDENPRPNTTMEMLAKLPTIYGSPTITAGNAPGLDAGASALMLMSREKAEQKGLTPMATVLAVDGVADEPRLIPSVPALAIQRVLSKANLNLKDIHVVEINEAFAAMPLVSSKILAGGDAKNTKDILQKTNVNGGAIAIGHPVGASGARILATMIFELRRRGGGIGACAICGGLAQGEAAVIKVE